MEDRQSNIIYIAKALAILFVVFGHTMIPSIRDENALIYDIWTVIYLFHMPVFFWVSGALFQKNIQKYRSEIGSFIKNKFKLLIVPYVSLSISIYLLIAVMQLVPALNSVLTRGGGYNVSSIGKAIVEILTYEGHIAKHLWFVLVLFFIFVINIMIPKCVNEDVLCLSIIILSPLLLPMIKTKIVLPEIVEYFIFEIPFFMMGRLTARNKRMFDRALSVNWSPLFFAVIVFAYLSFVRQYEGGTIWRWFFMLCMRVSGIGALLSVSAFVEKMSISKELLYKLEKKSYSIYLLHQPFMVSGCAGVLEALSVPHWLILIVTSVIGIAGPMIVTQIFRDVKFFGFWILGGRS